METILRMLSTFVDSASAQRMERTLQLSLPGDSLPFFLEKDRTGLSFVFQDAAWKEWGGFSSARSQDVGDSSTMGHAFLLEKNTGIGACSYSPIFPVTGREGPLKVSPLEVPL